MTPQSECGSMQQNTDSVAGVGKLTQLYDRSGNRKYLNPGERLRFYETVDTSENLARKTLCLVLIYTGCRITEALRLRVENIDASENTLLFKTLKQRGKTIQRVLPVPGFLIELLLQQAPSNKKSKVWPFTRYTALRYVKNFMTLSGLDGAKATCKGLRHAFAIDNLSEGVPLTTISKWLGHADIETTKIYLDFVGPEERALAKRAWPHLRSKLPPVSVSPATSVTEVKSFAFDGDAAKADRIMNCYIKKRQTKGWSVSQIEQLTGYDEYDGRKHSYTTGIMVIFIREEHSAPILPIGNYSQSPF